MESSFENDPGLSHVGDVVASGDSLYAVGAGGPGDRRLGTVIKGLFEYSQRSFVSTENVTCDGPLLVAYDSRGSELRRVFESDISRCVATDAFGGDQKEIFVGFAAKGRDHGSTLALDTFGQELWRYQEDPPRSVFGPQTGKFNVEQLNFIDIGGERSILVLINEGTWYQSHLVLLDPRTGKRKGEFLHSGRMYQAEMFASGNALIVRARNNHLVPAASVREEGAAPMVVFALDASKVYGQGPPFTGELEDSAGILWYYALSDRGESIPELKSIAGGVWQARATCGQFFYFAEGGKSDRQELADVHTCPADLKFSPVDLSR